MDLGDAEWEWIGPYLPPAKTLGRPLTTDLREVINAILYLLRTACPRRLLQGNRILTCCLIVTAHPVFASV